MHAFVRISLFLSIHIIAICASAQCPLDLNQSTTAPTSNLLLHLPLDSNATNLGSGSYTATVSGATYVPSQCGQALSFDGNDDYVTVTPSMDLVNDFTVTAWIAPNAQVDWMSIFSIREQCATTYRGYSIAQFSLGDYNVTTLSNQLNNHQNCTGFSGGDRYTEPAIAIPNGVETFVALTVQNNSSENRVVKLYVNCEEFITTMTLDVSTSVNFTSAVNYVTTIGAGSNVLGQTSTFDGTVDEVRVYDAVLDHEQILDIYQVCLPLGMSAFQYPGCGADSAVITLENSEPGVDYQLFDITNNQAVGPILAGCGTLTFYTGSVLSSTDFQVQATNTSSGCDLFLDSTITITPTPGTSYGNDSATLCAGDTLYLGTQAITTAGTYTDTITLGGICDSIVAYVVTMMQSPVLDLGPDTVICPNTTITLSTNLIGSSHLWQDGSTQSTLQVNQAGTYWVEVSDACGTLVDTVVVAINGAAGGNAPSVSGGGTYCEGESIPDLVATGMGSMQWYGDSTLTQLLGTGDTLTQDHTPGAHDYWITELVGGCLGTAVHVTSTILLTGQLELDDTLSLCVGDSVLLSVMSSANTVFWSTGDTSMGAIWIHPTGSGPVWAWVVTPCGILMDTVWIDLQTTPLVNAGPDATILQGQSTQLSGLVSGQVDFSWSPDQALSCNDCLGPISTPSSSMVYILSATTTAGCTALDTVLVIIDGVWEVYLPNVFSPNGDGWNDLFQVQGPPLSGFTLSIFNRWGEMVFESNSMEEAWDGTWRGQQVGIGVYVYQLRARTPDQRTIDMSGNVTLVH